MFKRLFTEENILLFFFGLFLLFKLIESTIPMPDGDPLYYHLVIGKVWVSSGFAAAHNDVCGALQAGIIEYVYAIPQFLGFSTFRTQQFGQTLHFLLSAGVVSIVLFVRYFKYNLGLALLAGIAFLTIPSGGYLHLAKSDGIGPALAVLASLIILHTRSFNYNKDQLNYKLLVVAVMIGLIPLVKINGLILSALLTIWFLFEDGLFYKIRVRHIIFVLIVFSLSCLILIRNWYFIKAPFFPAGLGFWPGDVTPRMKEVYTGFMASSITLISFIENLMIFLFGKLVFILIPIFLFLNFRKKINNLNYIFYVSLAYFSIFMVINGGLVVERFLFPSIFLNLLFLFESMRIHLEHINKKVVWLIIFLIILVDSRVDLTAREIANYVATRNRSDESILRELNSYNYFIDDIILSDNRESKTNYKILSDEFNQVFHNNKNFILHSDECNVDADFLTSCKNSDDLKKLQNYDFAILRYDRSNLCYEYIKNQGRPVRRINSYTVYELPNVKN